MHGFASKIIIVSPDRFINFFQLDADSMKPWGDMVIIPVTAKFYLEPRADNA